MTTTHTTQQIEDAIAAEAIDWAIHFEVTDPIQIEGRRNVMRANVKVGYLEPLVRYLPAGATLKRYIPLLRPATFSTLPSRLDWTYVEAPRYVTKRPDLPQSRHYHGVIECRELTKDEIVRFDLKPVD